MNDNVRCAAKILSVVVMLGLAGGTRAEEKPPEVNPKWDVKAMGILRGSVDYVNSLKSFTTTLYYTSTLDGGARKKKKEEKARYDVAVEKPNKFALKIGEGKLHCAVFSDGDTLWTHAPGNKAYTERTAPKTLSRIFEIEEINIANQDLQNLFFLDQYLMPNAFKKLMDGVPELKYVGPELIGLDKVHHLKFLQENFDWNLWIQDGPTPLLRRVSIDAAQMMKDDQGPVEVQLSFVSQFDNWVINQPIASKNFVFIPPPETPKVATFFKTEADYDPKLLGEAAPEASAKLLDGTTFTLSEHKGKNIVVLDFWATWCGPCRQAMPIFSEVIDSYKGKGVVGYAVNLMETPELVTEFQRMTPQLTLPILLDTDGKIAKAYRVVPIPMSVIVGKDGIIHAVHMGIPGGKVEILKSKLKAELDAMLAGLPVPK